MRDLAIGRMKAGKMNKTEAAYDAELRVRLHAGDILWYGFEPITFKLADNTRYTPDFAIMCKDRTMEMHEVKGFWRDDAKVKVKVAADKFPMFRFVIVKAVAKKHGGGFATEEIGN